MQEDVLSTKNAFITAIKRPYVNREGEAWKADHHHREACPAADEVPETEDGEDAHIDVSNSSS
jgi:hypothetical protein